MIFSVPDIDLDTSSLEELKAHARIVAGVENQLRAHAIAVQFEIIKQINILNGTYALAASYVPTKQQKVKAPRRFTREELIHEGADELDFEVV